MHRFLSGAFDRGGKCISHASLHSSLTFDAENHNWSRERNEYIDSTDLGQ